MENWYSMEENNKHTNNSDRNIFYEYFKKLEKKKDYGGSPSIEVLNDHYNSFININNHILKIIDNCYKSVFESKESTFSKCKKLKETYFLIENEKIPEYKHAVHCSFVTFKNFFNQFVATNQNGIKRIIEIIDSLIELNNNYLSFIVGGVKALCNISNIIEWLYAIIVSYKKSSNEAILFSLGCQKLELNNKSLCRFISADISRCKSALNPKSIFRTIIEDIKPLIEQFHISKVSKDIPNIDYFRKYFIIADCAYKKACALKYNKRLQNYGWDFLRNKYKIDNGNFNFNNMVYGIVCNNDNEIAIGFCGTEICRRPLTLLIDASQIANVSPGYVYAVGLVVHIKNETQDKNIVVCGHSLGGGLAQFAAATQEGTVQAYCYNSAGLFKQSYKKIKSYKPFDHIFNYRLEWDCISCFGKLIGSVYTAKATRLICLNHGIKALKKSLKL